MNENAINMIEYHWKYCFVLDGVFFVVKTENEKPSKRYLEHSQYGIVGLEYSLRPAEWVEKVKIIKKHVYFIE